MDELVEAFLADVLALERETANAVREGVRGVLTDYQQLFRAQETNGRMRDGAAHGKIGSPGVWPLLSYVFSLGVSICCPKRTSNFR